MEAYRYCQTTQELRDAYAEMLEHDLSTLAIDTETNGLNPFALGAQLVLIQVCSADGFVVMADARRIPHEKLFAWMKLLFEEEGIKIIHNAPFDLAWLLHFGAQFGLAMPVPLHDTLIAERLLTAGSGFGCDLKSVVARYLGIDMSKEQQKTFLEIGENDFSQEQLDYAALDTTYLEPIMMNQFRKLESRRMGLVYQLEMEVLPIAIQAGLHGVEIDIERWERHIENLKKDMDELQVELEERLQPYLQEARRSSGLSEEYHYYDFNQWLLAVSEWEADATAVYDRVVARAQQEIALWRADYESLRDGKTPLRSGKNRRTAAAEWRAENPEPGENRGFAQEMKRRWIAEHPKPEFCATTIKLSSGPQKAQALLALGVPLPKTEKGQFSTAAKILERYANDFPLIGEILRWTKYSTLIKSFGHSVLEKADRNHRLHPRLNTMGADTGRFSCAGPNVQQIPGNTLGKEFRNCFIAGEGKVFVCVDYSQIELRVLAEFANEPAMLWAFDNNVDLHSLNALKMFPEIQEELGVDDDTVSALMKGAESSPEVLEQLQAILAQVKENFDEQRKKAKTLSFGIPYGQTKYGFSDQWRVTPDAAEEIIQSFYSANPAVRAWLDQNATTGLARWSVKTPLGRTRLFEPIPWDMPYKLKKRKLAAYRRAMNNHPIQGGSADITKMAMVRVDKRLKAEGLSAALVMSVHDELVYEVPEAETQAVREIVETEMKEAGRVVLKRCPVDVSCKVGTTWVH